MSQSMSGIGQALLDPGSQDGDGGGAYLPGGHLSTAQQQQGRDRLGVEPLRNLRQGPHQGAHRSTMTGILAASAMSRKLASSASAIHGSG